MNNNYIEFKKKREIGEIISDIFTFLRNNFKPLFSILLKTSGLVFIFLLLAVGYYTYSSTGLMDPFNITGNGGTQLLQSGAFIIALFAMIASILIFYGLVFGTILHYIKEYTNNNGVVNKENVVTGVKQDLGNIIGLSIISTLIVGTGMMFCVLPGIYLYVPMALVFPLLVFNNVGVFDTIGKSFELVKNEWWITFATLLIVGLIAYLISMVFSIPAIMYTFFKTFAAASEGSFADPSSMFDWVFILLNTVASLCQYIIIYTLTAISSAFIYFNLNERKNHTGTLEQIDALGKSE